MASRRTDTLARAALALALLLSFGLFGGTCTSNAGRVFSGGGAGGGGGGNGGGGGGGEPPRDPAPPVARFDGALVQPGAPVLDAVGPADGATGVDVQSPVALWFSESLANASVTSGSLGIRRAGTTTGVIRTAVLYVGDRCVVLVPASPLAISTDYEVFATDDVHDLQGTRLDPPADGVLSTFRTAGQAAGRAPRVVASFPPNGDTAVPHDGDVLVAFSKPVDYASAVSNIRVQQVDGNGTPLGDAAVDAPTVAEQTGRLFPYRRTEGAGAADLGARLGVFVDPGVEDTEFDVNTSTAAHEAFWNTLAFGPPRALSTAATPGGEDQDIALDLLDAFPVRVDVAGNGIQVGDTVTVRISETVPASTLNGVASVSATQTVTAAQVGGDEMVFSLDLREDPDLPGISAFREGPVALTAFTTRAGLRSALLGRDDLVQDTVPPVLTRFGPPFASSAGTFLTDAPELRPYGVANEPIGRAEARFDANPFAGQDAAEPSLNGWFLAGVVSGLTSAERFSLTTTDFELLLTDAAGNPAVAPVTGRVGFRGFVGDVASNDSFTLQAHDAVTLLPVSGATFQIEATDGSDFRAPVTAAVGQRSFTGLAGRAYTVTVTAPGYHAATFYALQSTVCSLPLRPQEGAAQSIAPLVSLSNANGGEVRLTSSVALDDDEVLEPDGALDFTVPFDLGFSGMPLATARPGWFGGWFRLDSGDPFTQWALDARQIVDPFSPSTTTATPELEYLPLAGVATVDFPIELPPAPGQPPFETGAVASIPGLPGLAQIGIGEDLFGSPNTQNTQATVPDALRQAVADWSALDLADVRVDVFGRALYNNGARVMVRFPDATAAGPNVLDYPADVAEVLTAGLDPQAFAGVALQFRDALGLDGDLGYYRVVLDDGIAQWDLWVPGSIRQAGDPPLPTLDTAPLDDNLDATWTMFVEAFHMPGTFAETGMHFTALRRDARVLSRSSEQVVTQ